MEKQVLKPDKEYRKKAIIILIISIIAGLGVLAYFQVYIDDVKELAKYDRDQALTKIFFMLKIIMISMAFTLASFGIYVLRLSIKTIISEQFPPPGIKVIKETQVLRGSPAKNRGFMGVMLAVAIIISGMSFPAFFYMKIANVFQQPASQVNYNPINNNQVNNNQDIVNKSK